MSNDAGYQTRLERVLRVPLAEDVVRQWPQSGEPPRPRTRDRSLSRRRLRLVRLLRTGGPG